MIKVERITDAPLHNGRTSNNCHKICHVAIADSVGELAQATAKSGGFTDSYLDSSFGGRRDLTDLNDTAAKATQTWNDGIEIVERMLKTLQDAKLPQPETRRRRRRWSEDGGDDICLDRMRSGQQFWRSSYRPPTKLGGCITIVSDMRAACMVNHRNILWRGAAAIALTYLLERAGYRVELWTAQAAGDNFTNRDDMMIAAKIKAHSQPLDIGSAVSAVSAWFYRGIGFNAASIFPGVTPDDMCGYDRAGGMRLFMDRYFSRKGEASFVVESVFSEESAIELVKSASEAVAKGDLSACKWSYSCDTTGTDLVAS